jgi:uncharacterized protein
VASKVEARATQQTLAFRARLPCYPAGDTGIAPLDINPLYSLAGGLVGILVGLTGVGGGSLMTPLLVLLFGFHPSTAVGTDLLFASLTKTVGGAVHGQRGTVDWSIVRRLASGSVPAAVVTLLTLKALGKPSETTEHVIMSVLGVTLILTSISVLFRIQIVVWATRTFGTRDASHRTSSTILLGAILGVLVSISSVGAGAIGVTALLILYPGMPVAKIVGSDIAHAVPLTLVAGIGHWLIGTVDFSLLASLLVGSVPGIIIGSLIGSRASDKTLKPVLATVLMIVGAKLLL